MPSPFPGMNPFLEQPYAWEDFHLRFITHLGDFLDTQVGTNYFVKVESRLYLRQVTEDSSSYIAKADIGISEGRPGHTAPTATGLLEAPLELQLLLPAEEIERQSFLEICDRSDRRLVTVLELLSPTNKTPGPDHHQYLAKRRTLLRQGTNLVEIDLLRDGRRPHPPDLPPSDYYVLVCRSRHLPRVSVWPLRLRDRLPVVPVPLADPDPDVSFDLQAMLHHVYDRAGFAKYIYDDTPEPPLTPQDAAWAQQFIPSPPP